MSRRNPANRHPYPLASENSASEFEAMLKEKLKSDRCIQKSKFQGLLKQSEGSDDFPLEIKGTLYFLIDGTLSMSTDTEVAQKISEKVCNDEPCFRGYPNYEGDYIIIGKLDDEREFSVYLDEHNSLFSIGFSENVNRDFVVEKLTITKVLGDKESNTSLVSKARVTNLTLPGGINYTLEQNGLTIRIFNVVHDVTGHSYTDIEIREPKEKAGRRTMLNLIDWLSFLCGNRGTILSLTQEDFSQEEYKVTELWPGSKHTQSNCICVIQQDLIELFLSHVLTGLSNSILEESGLMIAMYWYFRSFDVKAVEVKLVCMFTAIETLVSYHKKMKQRKQVESSSTRLMPRAIRQKLEQDIMGIIDEYEEEIVRETDYDSFSTFKGRVKRTLENNQASTPLAKGFSDLLSDYKVVSTIDDFTDAVKFFRNPLVHQGLTKKGINFKDAYFLNRKAINMFIRLTLAIIGYRGYHFELPESGGVPQYVSFES